MWFRNINRRVSDLEAKTCRRTQTTQRAESPSVEGDSVRRETQTDKDESVTTRGRKHVEFPIPGVSEFDFSDDNNSTSKSFKSNNLYLPKLREMFLRFSNSFLENKQRLRGSYSRYSNLTCTVSRQSKQCHLWKFSSVLLSPQAWLCVWET